jgi:SAM-dependent methyltransferase
MLVSTLFEVEFLRKIKSRSDSRARQFRLLRPYFTPRTVFMHVGAAECSLALEAASYVERVYAVDPLQAVARSPRLPCNLRLVYTKDPHMPVAESTVDVAFSDALAAQRLAEIRRSLVPGGRYAFFSDRPYKEIRRTLRATGFGVRRRLLTDFLKKEKLFEATKYA